MHELALVVEFVRCPGYGQRTVDLYCFELDALIEFAFLRLFDHVCKTSQRLIANGNLTSTVDNGLQNGAVGKRGCYSIHIYILHAIEKLVDDCFYRIFLSLCFEFSKA